jgi:hypothetical protein
MASFTHAWSRLRMAGRQILGFSKFAQQHTLFRVRQELRQARHCSSCYVRWLDAVVKKERGGVFWALLTLPSALGHDGSVQTSSGLFKCSHSVINSKTMCDARLPKTLSPTMVPTKAPTVSTPSPTPPPYWKCGNGTRADAHTALLEEKCEGSIAQNSAGISKCMECALSVAGGDLLFKPCWKSTVHAFCTPFWDSATHLDPA